MQNKCKICIQTYYDEIIAKLSLTFYQKMFKIYNHQIRLKISKYFKDNLGSHGILYLQETHSTYDDKALWKANFQGQHVFLMAPESPAGIVYLRYKLSLNK